MTRSLTAYASLLADLILGSKKGELESTLDNFTNLLKEDDVLLQIELIIAKAEKIIEQKIREQTVTISSASHLSSEVKKMLVEKIEKLVPAAMIKEVTDESLLAGVKIELPNGVIDGSLQGQLNRLAVGLKV
jgi:F0F1-type ATP synthase delta subunit